MSASNPPPDHPETHDHEQWPVARAGQRRGRAPTARIGRDDSLAQSLDDMGDGADALRALLREGSSTNTEAAYRAAIQYWAAWHALRLGQTFALPVPVRAVLQFIADHVEHQENGQRKHDLPPDVDEVLVKARVKGKRGPYALNTVMHRIAVLSEAHETRGLPNPCRSRAVRTLLDKVRRAYAKRGQRPARKDALTREPLEQLLATCDDSLAGVRDRAILLFAWASGGRRRSEIVGATMDRLKRVSEGYVYVLTYSKTNQAGEERVDSHKPILGRAGQALQAWLHASGVNEGPIFRRLFRGGRVGPALNAESIRRMVQARARQAGLEGDFAAHSLRSGFVTQAGMAQAPLAETMAMSGHVSVNSVIGYHRAGEVLSSRLGKLLDD